MLQEARERSQPLEMSAFFAGGQWVTATDWKAEEDEFVVAADVGGLLEEYGLGVYDVDAVASLDGDLKRVSVYSIFHEVEPPDAYGSQ